jgi:hypothetical protein
MNPREYEQKHIPPAPLLPNIHPLVDKLYKPYDIGQVGQLDLQILAEIFDGEAAANDLTPAWDGGIYWAGQRRDAQTVVDQASTKSLALFYLSAWKNTTSAQTFAQLYADELGRKYSGLKHDIAAEFAAQDAAQAASQSDHAHTPVPESDTQIFSTNEGPVVITTRGKLVFVTESFDLDLASKLTALILDAQGTGDLRMAGTTPAGASGRPSELREPLTSNLVHFISDCGVMKAAVSAAARAAK